MIASMVPFEATVLSIALLGAMAYGTGDFMGGRASRRLSSSGAVAVAQCAAMAVTVRAFLESGMVVPGASMVAVSAFGGLAYAMGLLFLYQGIAHGRIGIVAPVCGIVGILVPLAGDILLDRQLSVTQFTGIAICACAVLLLAGTPERSAAKLPAHYSLMTGAISGLGYGTADLCLGLMSPEDGTGALMIARSVAALIALGLLAGAGLRWLSDPPATGRDADPADAATRLAFVRRPRLRAMLPAGILAAIAGVLDSIGHMSYVHIATQGSMAVAASLLALFPAVVVVLAVVVLRERIVGIQYAGLAASATGVLVISY